jgi:hypothetical protein
MTTVGVGTKLVDHDGTVPRGQTLGGVGVTSETVQLVPTGMLLIVCEPPSLRGNVAPPQLTVNWKASPGGSGTGDSFSTFFSTSSEPVRPTGTHRPSSCSMPGGHSQGPGTSGAGQICGTQLLPCCAVPGGHTHDPGVAPGTSGGWHSCGGGAHSPFCMVMPGGQTQSAPGGHLHVPGVGPAASGGGHESGVPVGVMNVTFSHLPFCNTVPCGQTHAPVGLDTIGATQPSCLTHSRPFSTVPGGQMQVGVQAMRQFGPMQLAGVLVVETEPAGVGGR